MSQKNRLKSLYESLKDINIINNNVDEKRELLKNYIYTFDSSIQNLKIDENITKQNKEISNLLEETINIIKKSSNDWKENFDEMIIKEKFRSDLSNYFIVIIFGKVKAGKSTLGNFIAKHRLDSQKVDFFKYDETGKKQSIKKLEEVAKNVENILTIHSCEPTLEDIFIKQTGVILNV